jgi:hypothetical protein
MSIGADKGRAQQEKALLAIIKNIGRAHLPAEESTSARAFFIAIGHGAKP